MAYKVNGNVVIDNSGNASLTNYLPVGTPVNLFPLNGNLEYGLTLTMTDYDGLFQGTIPPKFVQFQVANVNTFAQANIVYDTGNIAYTNSNTVTSLVKTETYYWRGRYVNNNDVSTNFSEASEFVFGGTLIPPDGLGCPYQGGYFTGNINIGGGVCYYLIVAPNATGCACCQWKTTRTASPAGSNCDGYNNTYPYFFNNASYPAGNFTATRSIAGYEDWYLPSLGELAVLRGAAGSMPAGEGWQLGEPCPLYWSSQQSSGNPVPSGFSFYFNFANGSPGPPFNKQYRLRTRAIRRVFIE